MAVTTKRSLEDPVIIRVIEKELLRIGGVTIQQYDKLPDDKKLEIVSKMPQTW